MAGNCLSSDHPRRVAEKTQNHIFMQWLTMHSETWLRRVRIRVSWLRESKLYCGINFIANIVVEANRELGKRRTSRKSSNILQQWQHPMLLAQTRRHANLRTSHNKSSNQIQYLKRSGMHKPYGITTRRVLANSYASSSEDQGKLLALS